ncbi:MAG TPA: phosphotransferase [Candidatus Binatia bacterium]|nr:phosphotransferase [Candidatus Binatia bacterium]
MAQRAPLTEGDLPAYLAARGLLPEGADVEVRALGGGVSNVVLEARSGPVAVVTKQALPRLRVADEWLATPERVLTEAAALRLTGLLTPGRVPRVLDVDPAALTITIERSPDGWTDWKAQLLAGRVDPGVAAELGAVLGTWHGRTWEAGDVAERFGDLTAFEQLRVDPYYRTVQRRRPELADAMGAVIDRMAGTPRCLVHGDFSPKNVLRGAGGTSPMRQGAGGTSPMRQSSGPDLWVVDAEVSHYGDPGFDTGFLLTHLALKSIHRPADRSSYEACALAFWAAYVEGPGGRAPLDATLGHLAALLLSRVHGKSPAEYLDEGGRARAGALGESLLLRPPASLDGVWERIPAGGADN